MLHLRLNARVIAAADTGPLRAELLQPGRAARAGLAGANDPVPETFPHDGLVLVLEKLTSDEAALLCRHMADAGGSATVLPKTTGQMRAADLLLAGSPRHFGALANGLADTPPPGPALGHEIERAVAGYSRRRFTLRLGARRLTVGPRPAIMGVLNVTPDSFSDGGQYLDPAEAVAHAGRLVAEGADLIDVGGESTRPGSDPVPEAEELRRVLPVIETLASRVDVPISIDTRHARVAREAASAGASLINDVTGLLGDPDMPAAVAETGAGCVIMHMLGDPKTMQRDPRYANLMADICRRLRRGLQAAAQAGVPEEAIIVDPGIGFGKTLTHNLEILARLGQLRTLGAPILVGPSRKRFIGDLTGVASPEARVPGTAAACTLAVAAGALLLRVHDVAEAVQALAVATAVAQAAHGEPVPTP